VELLTTLKLIIFVAASAMVVYISRFSLHNLRTHGFYRFFAWEAILILALLNVDYWFYKPFTLPQVISWPLLCIALYLVIHGFRLLRKIGRPDDGRDGASLIGVEKTTVLVTGGAYRYIRHPLYSSLLFLAWGIFFKSPTWIGAVLTVAAAAFLTATARIEESENLKYFGKTYGDYMKRTKMFVPFVF
jgi:protein-S-isoprenylcysteine O-methyltransferase Ste14